MNQWYYLLLLLLLLLIFINHHHTLESILPNITIQHVCENDFLSLRCLNINETIQIKRSMYGRTSQRICNHHLTYRVLDKTCANIEQSIYQTKFRCQGKSTCQMLISNQLFTDPCGSNIPKHFEIHYRCINREEICTKLFVNCSKSKDLQCIKNIQEEFSCSCPSTICRYVNQQLIGLIENSCPEENLQGFHWLKTLINKSRSLPCPSPCIGEISRSCHSNHQWSTPNYTNCQCPINESTTQLSTHRLANSYSFQCNFWLINRILPEENSCLRSFINWNYASNQPLICLVRAFQQMNFHSCFDWKSFGIDFENLAFEIYIPWKNENRFDLFEKQLHVDRTDIIRENFRANLPMMMMMMKNNQSIYLIEQENDLNSLQTANVTITFHHRSEEIRYQCRAYHSTNFSFNLNSSNMFFACQLLCSNGSHVICQCPFFNPFMHYILLIDKSRTENDLMIENDLNGKCSKANPEKIERYLQEIPSLIFAKKILLLIEKENFFSNWKIINQMKSLAFRLIQMTDSFLSITNHLEFFIKSNEDQLENSDRSVLITLVTSTKAKSILFFTLNTQTLFNSRIVNLNILSKNLTMEKIEITFRHINHTNQIPTCVNLKDQNQWNTDVCQLIATNFTHSICSCQHGGTFALLMNLPKSTIQSKEIRLLLISKIGSIFSIICLLFTILTFILIRSRTTIPDDLTTIRSILHTNMFLCLMLVQVLFLFGIDQMKTKMSCRISGILLDYFLLATFSWMFVDGIELLIAIKHDFKIDRIRLLAYSIYSYGFPLLIVILSVILSTKNGNGLSKYCWLSHDNAFIWAFGVPFTLLILGNLCFFLVSICRTSTSTEHSNKLRRSLRNISLISILFGLIWLVAIFYLYDPTILFAYVLTLLNSFHGLFILIFYYSSAMHCRNLFEKIPFHRKHCRSFFDCLWRRNVNPIKSLEGFSLPDNTSSSGYSSGHSSDLNPKHLSCHQTIDLNSNHYDRRICLNTEACYLPSVPNHLLTNRLSTFRYPLTSNEVLLTREQNEQLLEKNSILEDDHQYYEIR